MSDSLKSVTNHPFNAETPLPALAHPVTPIPLFYVRNHFDTPEMDGNRYRLQIEGAVAQPLALTLDQIKALPSKTLRTAMECAGNARIYMNPKPPGTPWDMGAISVADWTGTPLAEVLQRAGIGHDVVEVLFVGADGDVVEGKEMKYERSLPLNIALHPDTLLVWAMNGEPLTPHHGYPLRLFVPGWYGMAAVKWLQQIRLITRPFDGYFQTYHYVYWHDNDAPDGEPLQQMQIRALIYTPAQNATIDGTVTIAGIAWTGTGEVVRVEVSTEGESWHKADLEPATTPYATQCWCYTWSPAQSGRYTIRARATDSHGNRQPLNQRSNQLGYGNNAVHAIQVHVRS
jgi:DMSO/TMAO reductase YedYZ molybdopterin-dependent catalytic subunit